MDEKEIYRRRVFIMKMLMGVILLTIMGIANVSAQLDSLGTFKQGQVVRITQVCQDASYINISSIAMPNSTIVVGNTAMTSAGSGEYYYNFNASSSLGRYDVRGISNGCEKTFAVYFDVTSTGKLQGTWIPLFFLIGFAVMLALALWQKNEYFGLFSGFLAIVAGVYILIYGFGTIADDYTRMFSYISIGVGVILGFLSVLEIFANAGEGESSLNFEDE